MNAASVKPGDKIAVWFSCGAASAVAAKLTVEKYGVDCDVRILNNPVKEEHYDNVRFLADVERWIGHSIDLVINPDYPRFSAEDVWKRRKFMSGLHGAPCTLELKKKARQLWEKNNPVDWHVLGFTAEEESRHKRFTMTERDNVIPVLIEHGLNKQDCIDYLLKAGIEPPLMYKLGYPNANCIGCVKATSPTYWNHVRQVDPKQFRERAELSRELGAKLVRVNSERIFLDELDPKAKGRPMKSLDFECGTFCEEWPEDE
jgi:hypothetical protein